MANRLLDYNTNLITTLIAIPISIAVALILVKVDTVYAITAAIGLGVLVLTFINTDFAIYALIFSMLLSPEFGSRTTHGEGVTIRIDDVLLVIILFTWLAKTALYKDLGLFRKSPLNKPIAYYTFICFFATGAGMLFHNVKPLNGLFFVLKYIEYFLVYFLVVNQVRSKKQFDNFVIALLVTFVIVVIVAMLQIPSGKRLTAPFEGDAGEPNTLGGYLIFIIAINLSLVLQPGIIPQPKYRRLLLWITAISIFPFFLTNSRGSWAAAIPVVIAYIFLSNRRWIIVGFLAFFLLMAPIILPDTVIDRFRYTFQKQTGYAATLQENIGGVTLDTSASERVRSWRDAWQGVKKSPLFGYGITGWRFLDAQYMRVLIETGFFGLGLFLYLLYSVLNETWKVFKNAKIPFFKYFAQGFFVATIAMMTHSIGANTFIILRIMEPFWLVCGLVISIPYIEKIETEKLAELQDEVAKIKLGTI
ncbi:MAG TPA: O-antigen ligase domain-containing protein [Candidatus Marinimicrobia bacterium]|nr:O-antigen ligase domain-containing protein [Candidatus Neomarinimicrobiota bacterium]